MYGPGGIRTHALSIMSRQLWTAELPARVGLPTVSFSLGSVHPWVTRTPRSPARAVLTDFRRASGALPDRYIARTADALQQESRIYPVPHGTPVAPFPLYFGVQAALQLDFHGAPEEEFRGYRPDTLARQDVLLGHTFPLHRP